jgi:choline dehydrogenase-like flavoprotein
MFAGSFAKLFGTDSDWKIKNQPLKHANNREVDLFRGRFLGGSSGCNGTLAIRGTKQDYDDWNIKGWSGNDVFNYMKKA